MYRRADPKAVTIMQPFAGLVIEGKKRVENRSWPTSYRGPLLIHAGKSRRLLRKLAGQELPDGSLVPAEDTLTFGAILGTVWLADCVPYEAAAEDPWACGPWCWILEDAVALDKPFFCKGALGLWTPPRELVRRREPRGAAWDVASS